MALGFAATIYSITYVENKSQTPFYYTLILALISGMIGIVFAGDLLVLYVFWELMSVSSYALVAFFKEEKTSIEASFKFLIMSAAGSATALFGISLLYGLTGTVNFEGLTTALTAPLQPLGSTSQHCSFSLGSALKQPFSHCTLGYQTLTQLHQHQSLPS